MKQTHIFLKMDVIGTQKKGPEPACDDERMVMECFPKEVGLSRIFFKDQTGSKVKAV